MMRRYLEEEATHPQRHECLRQVEANVNHQCAVRAILERDMRQLEQHVDRTQNDAHHCDLPKRLRHEDVCAISLTRTNNKTFELTRAQLSILLTQLERQAERCSTRHSAC